MKIKVAILDQDMNYLSRVSAALLNNYNDKMDIYSFTDTKAAISEIENSGINILVVSETFSDELHEVPSDCVIAFLTELTDVEKIHGHFAICRYQKAENFYRRILNIYSEMSNTYSFNKSGASSHVVMFSSPCGGTGTSSIAAAFAIRCAVSGKRTIYLNLELLGRSELFFSGDGVSDLSEIIYAIKGKKSNLRMKTESALRTDGRGVYFIASAGNALDVTELSKEEILYFISELRTMDLADYIVVDMDFSLDKGFLNIQKATDKTVWVSDGSESSNQKIYRAIDAISLIDGDSALRKICIVYNKFSNKTGSTLNSKYLTDIGGVPRFEHAPTQVVLSNLSSKELFDKLM